MSGANKKTEGFTPCHCEIRAFFVAERRLSLGRRFNAGWGRE